MVTQIALFNDKTFRNMLEKQESLSQIIEGSPIPTFVIDTHHHITHWNKACENLTGIPAAAAVGTDRQWCAFYSKRRPVLADLILDNVDDEEIASYYADKFRKSFVKNGAFESEDFFPTLGENGRWLYFTAAPLLDSSGRIFGAIETLQDVTDRKLAEFGLKESERRYRSLFESADDSILLLKNEVVADCNAKTLELLKCERSAVVDRSIFNFFPLRQPDGAVSKDIALDRIDAVNNGQALQFEWSCCRSDGAIFDAEVSLTRVDLMEKHFLLAIVRDVTQRKNMEKDLRRREEELNHKTRHLAKANQALKAMLDHREIEKKAIEENMMLNLKKFVLPYLEEMSRCKMTQDAEIFLNVIKANLDNLIASLSNSLFARYQDLTPKEILVADLIRQGKSTKEIAEVIHISPGSVSFHRNNIRKKMGLLKKRINLRVYLASLT